MSDSNQPATPGQACAGRRLAESLLRFCGNTEVTLRISDPSSGDTRSQIGLEAPPAEDLHISPALIQALPPTDDGKRRIEAVIGATSFKAIAKQYGIEDISAWLLAAQGVLCYGTLMRIDSIVVDKVCGADCLYHLTATE
jgi:hypothetical protein